MGKFSKRIIFGLLALCMTVGSVAVKHPQAATRPNKNQITVKSKAAVSDYDGTIIIIGEVRNKTNKLVKDVVARVQVRDRAANKEYVDINIACLAPKEKYKFVRTVHGSNIVTGRLKTKSKVVSIGTFVTRSEKSMYNFLCQKDVYLYPEESYYFIPEIMNAPASFKVDYALLDENGYPFSYGQGGANGQPFDVRGSFADINKEYSVFLAPTAVVEEWDKAPVR